MFAPTRFSRTRPFIVCLSLKKRRFSEAGAIVDLNVVSVCRRPQSRAHEHQVNPPGREVLVRLRRLGVVRGRVEEADLCF